MNICVPALLGILLKGVDMNIIEDRDIDCVSGGAASSCATGTLGGALGGAVAGASGGAAGAALGAVGGAIAGASGSCTSSGSTGSDAPTINMSDLAIA